MSLSFLIDAEVYAPLPAGRRHLLVAGGQIVWMGTTPPAAIEGLGAEIVDVGGLRLIPGLVDPHVHLTGGGGEAGPETRVPPLALSQLTRCGVTSVIGLLGTDDVTRGTAALVATTLGLRREGLSAWCLSGGYHLPPATLTGSVRGDIALIDCIVGVGEVALSDHRSSQPTLDELLRLAGEVHVGGLMRGGGGVLHLHMGDGPRGLALVREALERGEIPPRIFHPTHVNRRRALFEEACALAVTGCTIDVTAFPVADGEEAWGAAEALGRYLDAGLPPDRITVSSDAGGCLPRFDAEGRVAAFEVGSTGAMARTLQTLLHAGRPLERILPAFSLNAAHLFGLDRKGRIAVGYDADLVVLTAAGEVRDVMARGRWHVRDGIPLIHGTFEGVTA